MVDSKDLKCTICGKLFSTKDKLAEHKKEHQEKTKKSKTMDMKKTRSKVVVGIIIAVIAILAVTMSLSQIQPSKESTVDGVECNPSESFVYHIHAHLDLYVDGKPMTVPAGIGIKQNECLYWLHTHDSSGVIHIESPQTRVFTLGQFIKIWDKTPGVSPKFSEIIHNGTDIRVFVNGNEATYNYEDIQIATHDEIAIISGKSPSKTPTSYEFGGL